MFTGLALASCGLAPFATPKPSFSLVVNDIDGPAVRIVINGQDIAGTTCYLDPSFVPVPELTAGPDLPLPWTIDVRRADGTSIGSFTERGDDGPREILIRGDRATERQAGVFSAGPAPVGECPP